MDFFVFFTQPGGFSSDTPPWLWPKSARSPWCVRVWLACYSTGAASALDQANCLQISRVAALWFML